MIEHHHTVAGEPVVIRVVEHEDDLDGFRDFVRANVRFLGLDSETTGLDIYDDKFQCRVVQFGTHREAWVIPVERGGRYVEDVRLALRGVQQFVLQNASYDLQVFDQTLGVPMEEMWPKVTDTKILAHLVDPRGLKDGGRGHSLEELTRHYVDSEVADNVKGLMKVLREKYSCTNATIWKKVPFDDPDYQLYSGMDPILAARLLSKLMPLVPDVSKNLIAYEHQVAEVCSYLERTGFVLDVDYAKQLSATLRYDESRYNEIALNHGCEMVNSTDQVADVIESLGGKIKGRTPSGKRQVNDDLLVAFTEQGGQLGEFSHAVIEAKKAGKWRKTWVEKFISTRDSNNRVHPGINPLQARTGRMSITNPPTQTLPKGDWTIRRCFLADEGQLISSVDYKAQELRVLAALSGDPTMIQAFKDDLDLHQITADAAGVEREVGKTANFQKVFGGGPGALADAVGIPFMVAKRVSEAFSETYPGVENFSQRLQKEASRDGYVITPTGRRLPVDPTRAYSALNYEVQSTARDVTCRALIRLHKAGFTPYMRLVIHDEILASLPEADAVEWSHQIGDIMAEVMGPVHISTDPDVGGRSWGSLYLKKEDRESCTDPYLLKAA